MAQREDPSFKDDLSRFDMPYIETKVPVDHSYKNLVKSENSILSNISEEEEKKIIRKLILLFLFIFTVVITFFLIKHLSCVSYSGDLGTYILYTGKKEIHTPKGEILEYTRQKSGTILFFSVTNPETGAVIGMNTEYPMKKVYMWSQFTMTQEELDLWFTLMSVESEYIYHGTYYTYVGHTMEKELFLIACFRTLPCWLIAIALQFFPLHLREMWIFLFIFWEEFIITPEYIVLSQRVAKVFFVLGALLYLIGYVKYVIMDMGLSIF